MALVLAEMPIAHGSDVSNCSDAFTSCLTLSCEVDTDKLIVDGKVIGFK